MPISSPHHRIKQLPLGGKIAVGFGALWLFVAAWPLMIAGIYAVVVGNSLRGTKSRWLLISAMIIPALLVEFFWVKPAVAWVMPDQKPATQQLAAKPPSSDKVQGAVSVSGQQVKLVQVVDGNTIDVDDNGQVYRVKLVGVTAPMVATQTQPAACYGQESAVFLDGVTRSKTLYLQEDTQATKLDVQGNLLRYVVTEDGIVVNLLMLDSGLAQTSTDLHSRQSEFLQAAETAKFNKKGMWAVCDTVASSQTVLGASTSASPKVNSKPSYTGPTAIPVVTPSSTPTPSVAPTVKR